MACEFEPWEVPGLIAYWESLGLPGVAYSEFLLQGGFSEATVDDFDAEPYEEPVLCDCESEADFLVLMPYIGLVPCCTKCADEEGIEMRLPMETHIRGPWCRKSTHPALGLIDVLLDSPDGEYQYVRTFNSLSEAEAWGGPN